MYTNYQYPIMDNYLVITDKEKNEYYLFGSYDGVSHGDALQVFKQDIMSQGTMYPFIKVHTDKSRDSDTTFVNIYQISKADTHVTSIPLSEDVLNAVNYISENSSKQDPEKYKKNVSMVKSYYGKE